MAETLNAETQPQTEDSDVKRFELIVKMSCGGCSAAIQRVLNKTPGVSRFIISLPEQSVDVWGTITYDDLLAVIKKTGKQVINGKEVLDGGDVNGQHIVS